MSLPRFAALALLLAAATPAVAQEATVQADVDARKVGVEDQVQLTLTVNGSGELAEDPVVPQLKNLRAVGGPFVSNQMSWINGRVSQSKTYTWALQGLAPGAAEVGAMHVRLASGEKATAPIALEVVAGSLRPQRARRGFNPLDPFGDGDPFDDVGRRGRGARQEPKLLVEASPSRTRVHVGEPLVMTYSVLTTVSLTDVQFKEPPQYPGFWSEELERAQTPPGGEPVSVDGQAYRRFPLLRRLLFPTRAGTLNVPAASLRLGLARQSFFDAGGVVERATQPLTITVEPIPTSPDFSGAVGQFRATATLDKSQLAFGEAATLRFQLEGRGNLKWVERGPDVIIPGAKVYPPQSKDTLVVGVDGMRGSKTWEYVVVPETAGSLEVPALAFSYFDPGAGRVNELHTAPLALRVAAASGVPASAPGPAGLAARAGAPSSGPSLRSDLDLPRQVLPSLSPRGLALALGLALAMHAALLVGARVSESRRLRAGRPAASRGARQALGDLRRAGRAGLSKEAAAALIEKAVHDAFGPLDDGTAAPADERQRAARALLQDVQFLRYAPQLGDYSDKIRELAGRAEDVVRKWA